MRVTSLAIYPIKSCRGAAVREARVGARGFAGDRRWMVVDEAGVFLTQRTLPEMTRVRCAPAADHIAVTSDGLQPLALPWRLDDGPRAQVEVWSDRVPAIESEAASAWMTRALARPCRVVFMPDDAAREVSFADSFPYLLATEASLAELSRRIGEPMPMERFRPNITIDGESPFAEDDWTAVEIGEVTLRVTRGCDRCSVTTVDPDTAERGVEPLRTLATFRQRDGKVWFGVNLAPENEGWIRVGDPVRPR